MAPYCYRCPYNKALPERADARTYGSVIGSAWGKWRKVCKEQNGGKKDHWICGRAV